MDTIISRHHNEPPLADRLALDHADLIKEATEAAALVPDQIRAIETDEEAAAYTDTAADIKGVIAQADAAFTVEKKPWREGAQTVDDFFAFRKGLTAAVQRVTAALNARANALLAAQRKAEAEAAALAKAAADAETERLRREAAAFDEPPPAPVVAAWVPPAPVKDVARVVSAVTGNKASVSTRWKPYVVDIEKVPRHYLIVNEKMLQAAVDGGIREIPGVDIREEARTSIRR